MGALLGEPKGMLAPSQIIGGRGGGLPPSSYAYETYQAHKLEIRYFYKYRIIKHDLEISYFTVN